jgi:carbamoyltransferase
MHILGISAFGDDSSAALVRDGDVLCAAQEERFTRAKNAGGFPAQAVRFCLESAGLRAADVDFIGLSEKPLWHFERQIETFLAVAPGGYSAFRRALPNRLGKRLNRARELDRALGLRKKRYIFAEHHEALAAAAFLPSPFEEAAILTIDGAGEWATMTLGAGRGNKIQISHEARFPHSVGLLYAAFAAYLGFSAPSGESSVMSLATEGEPRFVDAILGQLIDLKPDGSFWMNASYFHYGQDSALTSPRFDELFGGAARQIEEPITQRHKDLAASIQKATEEIVMRVVRHLHETTHLKNLAVSGAITSNSAVIGRITREGPFERVWVQPAAGDAGSALGVALLIQHQLIDRERSAPRDARPASALLGPRYSMNEIESCLRAAGANYEVLPNAERDARVAELLAAGQIVAWFEDRMEFGPRALGARSLLGDPRRAEMQQRINVKIKFREPFRAIAASVLEERASEWFDVAPGFQSPYGLSTATIKTSRLAAPGSDPLQSKPATIPAPLRGPVRIQTVDAARHPGLAGVLRAFEQRTGCPLLLNTSFNLSGEPIVRSPEDAWRTFMSSEIDALVLENALVTKPRQFAPLEARRVAPETGRERDPALEGLLHCPACGGAMRLDGDRATCTGCGAVRAKEEGIWRLFQPSEPFDGDITQIVKGFYEEHPFPNYDENESLGSLTEKARRGIYARLLGEQLPFNARIIEVGCGTGQLSNYLGIGCRTVVGADLCGNSLKLAEGFRSRHGLNRVRFVQMNLFRPAFAPESFDVVLCNGVLLTTTDPQGGFESIARLVKPGGHIVIGLYNTYGRLAVDSRRVFFRLTGGRMKWVDPHLRGGHMSPEKIDAWFHDQYLHPHETKQTMGEVLGWFAKSGFEFVSSVPNTNPWVPFTQREELFTPTSSGSSLDRAIVQTKMIVTGNREGGFFIMIGKRSGHA